MTCTICGRYAEPDRETGYDADEMCPSCAYDREWNAANRGDTVDPIESDLHDLGSVLGSLSDLVKDCHDPAKLFDVYSELTKLAKGVMDLQDVIGRRFLDPSMKAGRQ